MAQAQRQWLVLIHYLTFNCKAAFAYFQVFLQNVVDRYLLGEQHILSSSRFVLKTIICFDSGFCSKTLRFSLLHKSCLVRCLKCGLSFGRPALSEQNGCLKRHDSLNDSASWPSFLLSFPGNRGVQLCHTAGWPHGSSACGHAIGCLHRGGRLLDWSPAFVRNICHWRMTDEEDEQMMFLVDKKQLGTAHFKWTTRTMIPFIGNRLQCHWELGRPQDKIRRAISVTPRTLIYTQFERLIPSGLSAARPVDNTPPIALQPRIHCFH